MCRWQNREHAKHTVTPTNYLTLTIIESQTILSFSTLFQVRRNYKMRPVVNAKRQNLKPMYSTCICMTVTSADPVFLWLWSQYRRTVAHKEHSWMNTSVSIWTACLPPGLRIQLEWWWFDTDYGSPNSQHTSCQNADGYRHCAWHRHHIIETSPSCDKVTYDVTLFIASNNFVLLLRRHKSFSVYMELRSDRLATGISKLSFWKWGLAKQW